MSAYLSVFISSILWAISTQFYSKMVNKLTVFRFNFYKNVIAFVCFFIAAYFMGSVIAPKQSIGWLMMSGFLGLGLADLFIFYSFAKNGPARTMMLSAFSPSIIAIHSYFILGKTLPVAKVMGLFFLLSCLFFVAMERKRRGNVSLKIALLALVGVNLEALGVVFTKQAFMLAPELNSMTANLYRLLPAIVFLFIFNRIRGVKMEIGDIDKKTKTTVVASSIMGAFLALYFYLHAISKHGHPSIIAGLGSLAPIYASIYEHWRDKKRPNRYFIGSILSMIAGALLLIFA